MEDEFVEINAISDIWLWPEVGGTDEHLYHGECLRKIPSLYFLPKPSLGFGLSIWDQTRNAYRGRDHECLPHHLAIFEEVYKNELCCMCEKKLIDGLA